MKEASDGLTAIVVLLALSACCALATIGVLYVASLLFGDVPRGWAGVALAFGVLTAGPFLTLSAAALLMFAAERREHCAEWEDAEQLDLGLPEEEARRP